MRRMHLFEFEDQPWFPPSVREAMTDHLSTIAELGRHAYESFAARLGQAMEACGDETLVDLCSGAGSPAWGIAQILTERSSRPFELVLTDRYPNVERLERIRALSGGRARFSSEPVDAMRVPPSLAGFRLLCNAFHHFRPEQARAILADAVAQRRGIAVFEGMNPSVTGFVQACAFAGLMFAMTPFARPFKLSRWALTYAVPAAPAFMLWDGLVSWLRVYSPDELRALVASVPGSDGYVWDIGRLPIPASTMVVTYLLGYPREAANAAAVKTQGRTTRTVTAPRPPGPRGKPLVGCAFEFLEDPLGCMYRARQEHGGIARIPLGHTAFTVVSDPALIEQVLITDHKSYIKDDVLRRVGREMLGQGLLTSEGEFWKRQRRLVQHAFHRERIAGYARVMAEGAGRYADSLREGQTRDLQQDMLELTLRIVLRTFFSIETEGTAAQIAEAFDQIADRYAVGPIAAMPALTKLPLPQNRRFDRALARLDSIVADAVRRRRAQDAAGASGHTDLLAMLLEARDEAGEGMTDEQVRDEIVTMFSGGYETTALALSYGFLMLSQHPAAEGALSAELSRVLAGRAPTVTDLPALRYTEAVLLETMRLYPPAWGFGREAQYDTELGGFAIERGSQLMISPWVVHRNAEVFPDPEAFRPERWLDGLQKRLPRCAYLPFGGGHRTCIGHVFAMTEATLVLATIASRFRMRTRLAPGALRYRFALSMQSRDGMPARVEARTAG